MDASVRKRSRSVGLASNLPETKNRRETQNCRHFLRFVLQKCQLSQGSGGGHGREMQNCCHFWTRLGSSRLKSVNRHRDRGGSQSRNAELSSLLDSSRVFASQKCQPSQGSGGVMVAKCRIVVTFGLVSGLRVSKVSTVTGIGGGHGREMQNCRHFWTRLASSRLKSVNRHRDPGGSWSRNAELSSLLDSSRVFASQKCQPSQGSGGSWSRNAELSSLLDSSRVFSSQKCQPSQGSGGSWSRNAELSSLLDSSRVFASQKCQQSQGSEGVVVAKRRTVVTFGLASGQRRGERRKER